MFLPLITKFLSDDSGAVTADFVPLIAATVGLGLAVTGVVSGGVEDASTDIASTLTTPYLIQTSFPGQRMMLISSSDVISTISGKGLCAHITCDASQDYTRQTYTTTDGENLTHYASTTTDDEYWRTDDGAVIDYIPEQADGFCAGRCAPSDSGVGDNTTDRVIGRGDNRVPRNTSARLPIR